MTHFAETLKQINEKLDLPQPVRSRVLLEIAADLEAVENHFLEEGLAPQTARRKAIEHCDLSDDALAQLVQVHMSWYRRFLDRLSAQAQTRWERTLVMILLAFVAATTGPIVLSTRVFDVASPVVWPVLGIAVVAVIACGMKFYSLYLKQDHEPKRMSSGLPGILALGGVNLFIGTFGCWLELAHVARGTVMDPHVITASLAGWALSSSATLMVCYLTAILIALLWFLLANKVARIEQAEATLLFD
jgi:hypothetical protein